MMNTFVVRNKETNQLVTVYDIKYDSAGYPHFLVYIDGQWLIRTAKHYIPEDRVW